MKGVASKITAGRSVWLGLALALPLVAGAQESLCRAGELVIFSCRIGHKTASACASATLGPASGYVRYRFGKPKAIELDLRVAGEEMARSLEWNADASAGGSGSHFLRITNGQYGYVLHEWWKHPLNMSCDGPCQGAGVLVEREGERVKQLSCNSRYPVVSKFDPKLLDGAQIPRAERFPQVD
jgi:hypothetical protein